MHFFDGTLGAWKKYPVEFKLKENAKPIRSISHPVLKVREETFKKYFERLVSLGGIEIENNS